MLVVQASDVQFPADLKEELEKEKESQNAIRKRIEEETKTTGGQDIIFSFCICIVDKDNRWGRYYHFFLYLYCICIGDKDNRWARYLFGFPVFVLHLYCRQ